MSWLSQVSRELAISRKLVSWLSAGISGAGCHQEPHGLIVERSVIGCHKKPH